MKSFSHDPMEVPIWPLHIVLMWPPDSSSKERGDKRKHPGPPRYLYFLAWDMTAHSSIRFYHLPSAVCHRALSRSELTQSYANEPLRPRAKQHCFPLLIPCPVPCWSGVKLARVLKTNSKINRRLWVYATFIPCLGLCHLIVNSEWTEELAYKIPENSANDSLDSFRLLLGEMKENMVPSAQKNSPRQLRFAQYVSSPTLADLREKQKAHPVSPWREAKG